MRHAFQSKQQLGTSKQIIQHDNTDSIRLNKYIGSTGAYSRREADRLIEDGRVMIDNVVASVGSKVSNHQSVFVDGIKLSNNTEQVYIALHKPIGITCTTDTTIPGNIAAFMNHEQRIFPIGRLDKPSSGLILLTNDGDIVNKILRSINNHEKEYIVSVNKTINDDFLNHLRSGIQIYNPVSNKYQTTKKCKVKKINDKTFNIILTEGLNRQIRRMCTACEYRVTSLKRIRVMNISLNELVPGEWRYLSEDELIELNTSLSNQ